MNTPGDKQGAASAGAVDDVDRIVLMKVHFRFSIDAMTALVRTGEVPRCYAFATLRRHQLARGNSLCRESGRGTERYPPPFGGGG
ncbi:hypothetical protein HMPREF9534_03869, partial [Escherichia coli MS 69-1]